VKVGESESWSVKGGKEMDDGVVEYRFGCLVACLLEHSRA